MSATLELVGSSWAASGSIGMPAGAQAGDVIVAMACGGGQIPTVASPWRPIATVSPYYTSGAMWWAPYKTGLTFTPAGDYFGTVAAYRPSVPGVLRLTGGAGIQTLVPLDGAGETIDGPTLSSNQPVFVIGGFVNDGASFDAYNGGGWVTDVVGNPDGSSTNGPQYLWGHTSAPVTGSFTPVAAFNPEPGATVVGYLPAMAATFRFAAGASSDLSMIV